MIFNASGRMLRWARARASAEHGFTMVIALGVLLVTSLLLTAVFYAVSGDIHIGTENLAAKRAYAAADAGVQAYLYQMNQNPNYWETCANNTQSTPVTVPGSADGGTYTFQPIYANGNTSCTSNVINSLVDSTDRFDPPGVHRLGWGEARGAEGDRGQLPDGQPARFPLVHALRSR